MEPLSICAINATITLDVTPTGKPKFFVKLDDCAGTAIDRLQSCYDYRISCDMKNDQNIFDDGSKYLAYSFYPKSSTSSFLLTCRCSQSDLSKQESHEWIAKGMKAAIKKLNSLTTTA